MKITKQQLSGAGAIDNSPAYKNQLARFKEAVRRAKFLSATEKRHWTMLGYILTTNQLLDAEKLIISEDLRVMQVRQQLEKIKPKAKQNV